MRGLVWAIFALALTAIVAVEVVTLHGFVPAFAPGAWPAMLAYGAVMATFALFLYRHRAIRLVTWRPVVVIGLASYPLYLFHERAAMTALPYLVGFGVAPAMGAALIFAGLIAVAAAIHHLAEQPARRALTRWSAPGSGEPRPPAPGCASDSGGGADPRLRRACLESAASRLAAKGRCFSDRTYP